MVQKRKVDELQLADESSGKRQQQQDAKQQVKVTEFQQRVYDTISTIPEGYLTTYKLLAKKLGCGSCQAVGQALRHNPFAPVVPCHRVIKNNLQIGGFSGQTATNSEKIQAKVKILSKEGVSFMLQAGRYVLAPNSHGRIWTFSQQQEREEETV